MNSAIHLSPPVSSPALPSASSAPAPEDVEEFALLEYPTGIASDGTFVWVIERLAAVPRLGHHLRAGDRVEQGADAAADERVVVGQQDPDGGHGAAVTGTLTRSRVPSPGDDWIWHSPPSIRTRSCMPSNPSDFPVAIPRIVS